MDWDIRGQGCEQKECWTRDGLSEETPGLRTRFGPVATDYAGVRMGLLPGGRVFARVATRRSRGTTFRLREPRGRPQARS